MSFNEFVKENSGFILTFIGMIGGGMSLCLMCILKSRCEYIKCCGLECKRQVIPAAELNDVELNSNTH